MKAAVAAANEQVLAVRKRGGKDDEMGTTLVAAWIGRAGVLSLIHISSVH